MVRNNNDVPAISGEIEFIARHVAEAEAIRDDKDFKPAWLKKLSDKIYDRADADVEDLIFELQEEIRQRSGKIVEIRWRRYKRSWWELNGQALLPRGKNRKELGWVYLTVSYGSQRDPRIIGSFYLGGGGRDTLKRFAQFCKIKNLPVHLISDDRTNYSIWEGSDGIVWFDRKLTSKVSRASIALEVAEAARDFFSIAKAGVKKLGTI